jgi:hypothetical protein
VGVRQLTHGPSGGVVGVAPAPPHAEPGVAGAGRPRRHCRLPIPASPSTRRNDPDRRRPDRRRRRLRARGLPPRSFRVGRRRRVWVELMGRGGPPCATVTHHLASGPNDARSPE